MRDCWAEVYLRSPADPSLEDTVGCQILGALCRPGTAARGE